MVQGSIPRVVQQAVRTPVCSRSGKNTWLLHRTDGQVKPEPRSLPSTRPTHSLPQSPGGNAPAPIQPSYSAPMSEYEESKSPCINEYLKDNLHPRCLDWRTYLSVRQNIFSSSRDNLSWNFSRTYTVESSEEDGYISWREINMGHRIWHHGHRKWGFKPLTKGCYCFWEAKGGYFILCVCVCVCVEASMLMIEFVEAYVSSRQMDTRIYEYIFSFPCTVFQVQYSM